MVKKLSSRALTFLLPPVSLMGSIGLAAGLCPPVHASAYPHPDISGFWAPRAGTVHRSKPSFTEAAAEELKKPSKLTDPNGLDDNDRYCLPYGQPWTLIQSAPIDIVQDDRETTMLYEDRTLPFHIYTDGRGHPDAAHLKLTLQGNSIGHWDGDEFVVDSVGFANDPAHGALMFLPNDPTTHVVARFKLAAGGSELDGHFHVVDPKWLTKPYDVDVVWYRSSPDDYARVVTCDPRDSANSHG